MRVSLLCVSLLLVLTGVASSQYKVRRLKGEDLSPGVIDSKNLTNKKIVVTDFMGEIDNNFTTYETKRGLRGPYYIKFRLRDSKLRCIVSKYDRKNYDRLMKISKDARVTVVGRIQQLAFGIKRFSNPYYILRVNHIEPAWRIDESEDIFSGFSQDAEYEEIAPKDISTQPEKFAGEYLKIKDRFSLCSSFFTQYERDINLDNERAHKFYLENCSWPCYMLKTEKNGEILDRLASGERITLSGRLNLIPFDDDALLLFSVSKIKIGW